MKKNIIVSLVFILFTISAYAQDRVGTGGSGQEIAIVNEAYKLEDVAEKIIGFFMRVPSLRSYFTEVNLNALVELRGRVTYEITEDELRDDEGTVRSCLNFDITPRKKIICNLSEMQNLSQRPEEYFTLVAHELFGLVGLEESSINHDNLVYSYPISGRIARYVSRVSSYDLVYNSDAGISHACSIKIYSDDIEQELDLNSDFYIRITNLLVSKGFHLSQDEHHVRFVMVLGHESFRYRIGSGLSGAVYRARTNLSWSLGPNVFTSHLDNYARIRNRNRRMLTYRLASNSASYKGISLFKLFFSERRVDARRFNRAFNKITENLPTCAELQEQNQNR